MKGCMNSLGHQDRVVLRRFCLRSGGDDMTMGSITSGIEAHSKVGVAGCDAPLFADVLVRIMSADWSHAIHACRDDCLVPVLDESPYTAITPIRAPDGPLDRDQAIDVVHGSRDGHERTPEHTEKSPMFS